MQAQTPTVVAREAPRGGVRLVFCKRGYISSSMWGYCFLQLPAKDALVPALIWVLSAGQYPLHHSICLPDLTVGRSTNNHSHNTCCLCCQCKSVASAGKTVMYGIWEVKCGHGRKQQPHITWYMRNVYSTDQYQNRNLRSHRVIQGDYIRRFTFLPETKAYCARKP